MPSMDISKIRNNIRAQLDANKRDRNEQHNINTNTQSNRYYGSKYWKTLRDEYMASHPICENCLHYNIITSATECHHLHRFMSGHTEHDRWALLLDRNNIRALCSECHKLYHKQMREQHTNVITDYIMPTKLQSKLFDLS